MKKIMLAVLLTLTLSLVLFKSNVSAQNTNKVKNLIKVSNLLIYEEKLSHLYYRRTLHLMEPISVNSGKTYTLVLGEDFFHEQTWENIDYEFEPVILTIYNHNPNDGEVIELDWARGPDCIFVSFQATHSLLDFIDLSIEKSLDVDGATAIVLYEGVIDDFQSIISYSSNLEPIKGAYVMNYDDLKTTNELLELFSFADNIDSVENLKIDIVYNAYESSNKDPGVYEIIFSVTDKRYNKIFYDLTVKILDITPPIISGQNYYEVEAKKHNLDIGMIIQGLNYEDNHTNLHPRDLHLIQDDFSDNMDIPGEYLIEVKISDMSNNQTIYPITVKVMDNTPPVITGPYEIYRYLNDPVLGINDYKALFSSFDEIEGDLTETITITGDYNPNQVGTNILRVKSMDSSGNEASKSFRVHVVDGEPPTITTNELIISFEIYSKMDRNDMIDWLNQHFPNAQNIEILYDETLYLKNAKTITYVYYSYELDGKTYYSRLAIEPAKFNVTKTYIAIIGFLTINIIFTIAYIKRFKKLVIYS